MGQVAARTGVSRAVGRAPSGLVLRRHQRDVTVSPDGRGGTGMHLADDGVADGDVMHFRFNT